MHAPPIDDPAADARAEDDAEHALEAGARAVRRLGEAKQLASFMTRSARPSRSQAALERLADEPRWSSRSS